MVALSWDGTRSPAAASLSLRSRSPEGWTPWTPLTLDPRDQGGEGVGRVGTDVVWLGSDGADAVEVRVDNGPLVGLELLRMRYHAGAPQAAPEQPQSRTATGRAARPVIRPRSDWASGGWKSGTSGCGSGPTVAPSLKHAVVHHTASTNSYTAAPVPGLIDGIYRYHTASLGWCDIAYNFVVDKFGTIWQGRSGDVAKPVVGGHAMGFNTGSVGVTLLGQFEPGASPAAAEPTTAMLDSAAKVLAWKLSLHGLDPKGSVTVVSGGNSKYPAGRSVTLPVINYHRLSSDTACPGANVINRFSALRDSVQRYMTATTPPPDPPPTHIDWAPFDQVEDLVWRQFVDFRRDPGTYDDRRWWATQLSPGDTNRNALVASLVRSPDVDDRSAAAVRLYLAYFGRIPDHAGIRYWWSDMDDGMNLRTVSARFTGSPEFKSMYGGLSDDQFVSLVYRNVLGRKATADDLAYWTGQIRSGRDSRGGVMALFSETAENKTRSKDVMEVILIHEAMLDRAISAQSHMEWVARVADEGIGPLIGAIYASQEYAARVGG